MKILYVTTISATVNTFLVPHIRMLIDEGYCVDIACQITKEIDKALVEAGCSVYNIPFQRSPLNKKNIGAYSQLRRLILCNEYDIVHCHTPVASFITRCACRKHRKKGLQVFYTAHGFHFYRGAPLINWLVYYPIERWAAHHTDVLLTINKEDYAQAKTFKAKRVEYVPGVGLDIDKYAHVNIHRKAMRESLSITEDAIVLLSVGRLDDNKNHQIVIRAMNQLKNEKMVYVIAGPGPNENKLRTLAKSLGLTERLHLLGYRSDVRDLYHMADVFVFPSRREGLPVALMEAMASGLPVVCSEIRGNVDLIDASGGRLFDPHNEDVCRETIAGLVDNGVSGLTSMAEHNQEKIMAFSIESVLKAMKEIYRII